jgi:FemAB-related protein (PEP-CTERM system-associated)
MRIIRSDASSHAAWNAFVHASPRASFYHRAEWQDINERCFGHRTAYLAAVEGDRVVGVFPIVQLKSRLFGNVACSMPFVNYGGPCGETDAIEQRLLSEAEALVAEWKADYLEIRSRRDLGERYPSSTHKVSMTIDLNADPDVLWNGFKSSHRNEVRRAYKHGFTARFGPELIDDFYAVLSESWRDLGTPIYSKSYLNTVLGTFPGATRICVVYAADGTPAAAAFDGVHNGTVEGMWMGTRAAYRRQLVGYVLYWELVKHACESGFQRFHLGRSTADSGGEQFKKKWNAEAMQLYWQYVLGNRTAIPALNVDNPKYQFAIKMWQRLPVPVTQAIGPFISKSIP